MLKVDEIHVRYGRIAALRGVSVEVSEGELVSIIGPNGAGKSTLLLTIAGVLKPAQGTIRFDDRVLPGRAPEQIVRLGISLVPEGRHIFTRLTVAENLRLVGRNHRGLGNSALKDALDLFPILEQRSGTLAGKLSGGEQQMLAIARALISRPRMLLLDEPSLGLAPTVTDSVFDVLRQLRERGVTILLVEQHAERALELADRTYMLRTGVIEATGTSAELREAGRLETLYLGSWSKSAKAAP